MQVGDRGTQAPRQQAQEQGLEPGPEESTRLETERAVGAVVETLAWDVEAGKMVLDPAQADGSVRVRFVKLQEKRARGRAQQVVHHAAPPLVLLRDVCRPVVDGIAPRHAGTQGTTREATRQKERAVPRSPP